MHGTIFGLVTSYIAFSIDRWVQGQACSSCSLSESDSVYDSLGPKSSLQRNYSPTRTSFGCNLIRYRWTEIHGLIRDPKCSEQNVSIWPSPRDILLTLAIKYKDVSISWSSSVPNIAEIWDMGLWSRNSELQSPSGTDSVPRVPCVYMRSSVQ